MTDRTGRLPVYLWDLRASFEDWIWELHQQRWTEADLSRVTGRGRTYIRTALQRYRERNGIEA